MTLVLIDLNIYTKQRLSPALRFVILLKTGAN